MGSCDSGVLPDFLRLILNSHQIFCDVYDDYNPFYVSSVWLIYI